MEYIKRSKTINNVVSLFFLIAVVIALVLNPEESGKSKENEDNITKPQSSINNNSAYCAPNTQLQDDPIPQDKEIETDSTSIIEGDVNNEDRSSYDSTEEESSVCTNEMLQSTELPSNENEEPWE